MSSPADPTSPDRRPVRADGGITVVLVHGAFADASSWSDVVETLQHRGHTVVAPTIPLRGLIADTSYIASVVSQIDGPVLHGRPLLRRSRITNAATTAPTSSAWSTSPRSLLTRAKCSVQSERLEGQRAQQRAGSRQYPTGQAGQTATEFGDRSRTAARRLRGRSSAAAGRGAGGDPTAGRRGRLHRSLGLAGLETVAVLGGRRDRRPGCGNRRRPLDGPAGRCADRGARGLARDHDLASGRGGRRDRRGLETVATSADLPLPRRPEAVEAERTTAAP